MSIDVGSDHCRVVPPRDAEEGFERFEFFRHLYAYSEAGLRISPTAHVLEVGCGEGYGINYLSSRIAHATATDLSLQALIHARAQYPGPRFCQTVGTCLPFASGTFDAVVSFQVIEHIAEVNSYAQEVCRILKPGGNLFLTTPNRKLRLLSFQKPWNPYHVREYSGNELYRFLKHRFEPVQMYGIMAQPALMATEKARVKQEPSRVLGQMVKRWFQNVFPVPARQTPPEGASDQRGEPEIAQETIGLSDFFLSSDIDQCLDLFVVATKLE